MLEFYPGWPGEILLGPAQDLPTLGKVNALEGEGLNLGHSRRASWRKCLNADLEEWVVTMQGVRVPVGRFLTEPGS